MIIDPPPPDPVLRGIPLRNEELLPEVLNAAHFNFLLCFAKKSVTCIVIISRLMYKMVSACKIGGTYQ